MATVTGTRRQLLNRTNAHLTSRSPHIRACMLAHFTVKRSPFCPFLLPYGPLARHC